jgi:hypothetical protein
MGNRRLLNKPQGRQDGDARADKPKSFLGNTSSHRHDRPVALGRWLHRTHPHFAHGTRDLNWF